MTRLDGNLIFYKLLTAQASLMTLCSNRVFGPPLGIPSGMTAPARAISFGSNGAPANISVPMADESFRTLCYGADQADANSVYLALADILNRRGRTVVALGGSVNAVIRHAILDVGPVDLPDPGNDWPRVIADWRIVYLETALP